MKNRLKGAARRTLTGARLIWPSGQGCHVRRSMRWKTGKFDPSLPLAFTLAEVFGLGSRIFSIPKG